jgi:DNA-directed RNA polymerase subunit F
MPKTQKQLQHELASELESLTHEELKKIARLINKFYGTKVIDET